MYALLPLLPVLLASIIDCCSRNQELPVRDLPVSYTLSGQIPIVEQYLKRSDSELCTPTQFWQALAQCTELRATKINTLSRQDLYQIPSILDYTWRYKLSMQDKHNLNGYLPGFSKFIQSQLTSKELTDFKGTLWKKINQYEQDLQQSIKKLFPHGTPKTIHDSIKKISDLQESEETQKIITLKNDIQALLTLYHIAKLPKSKL